MYFLTSTFNTYKNNVSYGYMQHQDWEQVIFKKPPPPSKVTHASYDAINAKKIDLATDPEHLKHVSKVLASAITQARCLKQLKQTDVDKSCNFPPKTCQNIEGGKAIYNPNEINKIARLLGLNTSSILVKHT